MYSVPPGREFCRQRNWTISANRSARNPILMPQCFMVKLEAWLRKGCATVRAFSAVAQPRRPQNETAQLRGRQDRQEPG